MFLLWWLRIINDINGWICLQNKKDVVCIKCQIQKIKHIFSLLKSLNFSRINIFPIITCECVFLYKKKIGIGLRTKQIKMERA